jgi:hypothetical protein
MGCNAGGFFNGTRSLYHFAPEVDDIRRPENAIYLSAGTDDRWNMLFTMVLDSEQIGMRLDDGEAMGIPIQPFFGGEDRRRNPILNQKIDEVVVVFAGAGIKRQGDPLAGFGLRNQLIVDFDSARVGSCG